MKRNFSNIKKILFPHHKINIFIITVLFLGIISGAIFSNIIDINNKNLVIDKINLFITNINTNNINTFSAFKNSIIINISYITIIWILGLTIIGIPFNVFLLYLKSFIFSFSISSFIITFGYIGITISTLYLLFGQLLNIITILIITIYSIMFTKNLLKTIIKNKTNNDITKFFKTYLIILLFTIIISIISSISEVFIFPTLIKLIIKLFI